MVGYVESNLKEMKLPGKKIVQAMLVTEEVVDRLVENAGENEIIYVEIGGILGNVDIRFRAKGTAFDSGDIAGKLMFTGAGADNVFAPIYTMFMNALKMIVAPLVFCSVAASIADFGDLKALGRIAAKVVTMYLITSAIAIFVGYVTYQIFPIGDTGPASAVNETAAAETIAKGESATVSIRDTLVGIIPDNIITPFAESDMLQLIFMAVVLGITAAAISTKLPGLKNAFVVLNNAFSKITSKLVSFIPLIVFCSMAKLMVSMKFTDLAGIFVWVPTIYFGDVIMIIVYMLMLTLLTGLNPLRFLGKYYQAMIAAFTLASSNAALSTSVRQCNKLGISEKVYSFSLPLGATINMDGSCITLVITSLW